MKRSLLVSLCMVCAAATFAQETAREVFQQAESRFQSGDYEVALQRYETLVRDFPFSEYVPDAQFRRAVALYHLERYETALAILRRIEARYRSTRFLPLVPFWKGVALYRLGDYPDAEEELGRFLDSGEAESLRPQARLYRALILVAQNEREHAISTLEALFDEVDVAESESYALALLMSLYVREERYEEAADRFAGVDTELVSERWRSNVKLYGAESLRAVGRDEEALEVFLDLTDAGPTVSGTAFRRAYDLAQGLGRQDTAREVVREAERVLAGRTDVLRELWIQVGIASYEAERRDTALLYLTRVWELEDAELPGTVPLYLSEIYEREGRSEDALEVLEEARERGIREHGDRALLRQADLYLELDEAEAAVEALDRFHEEYPDSDFRAEGEYLRAFALYRLGRDEQAVEQASETIRAGRAGDFEENLLWLRSILYRRLGRTEEALRSLRDYLALSPDDLDARVEFSKLLFERGRHEEVLRRAGDLLEEQEIGPERRRDVYYQLRYIEGLSHVALKDYEAALESFAHLPEEPEGFVAASEGAELELMYPFVLYYEGWSHYRLSRYREAEDLFAMLLDYDEDHEFAARAAYLAGWSAFNRAASQTAAEFLRTAVSLTEEDQVWAEATLLLGRSLKETEAYTEADTQFQNIYVDRPDSPLADDALFEYAEGLERRGRLEQAVAQYRVLAERYPESRLAQEAMYRRGELLYEDERYAEARDAFSAYRSSYPDGELVAPALYWGGVSAYEVGEESGALLLWEQLIEEHRESSLRPDAMQRAAEVHRDRGDYRHALNLYSRLVARYPEQAEAMNAPGRLDELLLRIGGLSEREAEVWVRIEQNRRASTSEGRRAILEAARISIREGGSGIDQENLLIPLLRATTEYEEEDPEAAAQAHFLLGEYHLRNSRPVDARESFLRTASTDPDDRDRTAEALFRAAEASLLADRAGEARSIVERLQSAFPESEWTSEALLLLEEEQG
ncbi:MAG: tetratricopeptide repeat protein [Spirochaetaceae bacterium]